MKAIMISIKPEFVEKILNGKKTIEIRKTKPKCELPCKVYIYCTNGKDILSFDIAKQKYALNIKNGFLNGQVVAEFTLKQVDFIKMPTNLSQEFMEKTCLTGSEIMCYLGGNFYKNFYAWHIDNLKIYDKPKELSTFGTILKRIKGKESRFTSHLLQRPPQSWCYVEEDLENE